MTINPLPMAKLPVGERPDVVIAAVKDAKADRTLSSTPTAPASP